MTRALEQVIETWREHAKQADRWAFEHEQQRDGANAHAFRKERRIWTTCADDLAAALALPGEPATQHIADSARRLGFSDGYKCGFMDGSGDVTANSEERIRLRDVGGVVSGEEITPHPETPEATQEESAALALPGGRESKEEKPCILSKATRNWCLEHSCYATTCQKLRAPQTAQEEP